MPYCTDCGTACSVCASAQGEKTEADREVEMERLRTHRDIEVARINANAEVKVSATEAESGLAAAAGEVAGMETVLETVGGGGDPETESTDPAIVVEVPADEPDEPEPTIEPRDDSVPPETDEKRKPLSYWG